MSTSASTTTLSMIDKYLMLSAYCASALIGRKVETSELLHALKRSHEVGLANLEWLAEVADDLKTGAAEVAREKLRSVLQFFDTELAEHFRQEEEALFPLLEGLLAGPGPVQMHGETPDICGLFFCDDLCGIIGPLAVYRREHQMICRNIEIFKELARELDNSETERQSVIEKMNQAVRELEWLLGSHIAKENEVLLLKAAEVLGVGFKENEPP